MREVALSIHFDLARFFELREDSGWDSSGNENGWFRQGLMAVRLAITAVIAHDGRFDQARAVAVGTDRQDEHGMTRMLTHEPRRLDRARIGGRLLTCMTSNDIADQRAQFGLSHSRTST